MKRIDVEPLSEQRWTKIEKETFAELDRVGPAAPVVQMRNNPWTDRKSWGVLAACGMATLALVIALREKESGSTLRRLSATDRAEQFDVGPSRIGLAPHSTAVASGDEGQGVLVALQQGRFEFAVATRAKNSLLVQAGEARFEARQARFRVAYFSSQAHVEVQTGWLEVHAPTGKWVLSSGQSWDSTTAKSKATAARKAEGMVVTQAAVAPSTPLDAGVAPIVSRSGKHMRGGHTRRHVSAPASVTETKPTAIAEPDRERYERAARIEGTRPDEAAALYFELSQAKTAWAENALFALGRLELERGHVERGKSSLARYLSRYPSGRNADDARRLLKPAP